VSGIGPHVLTHYPKVFIGGPQSVRVGHRSETVESDDRCPLRFRHRAVDLKPRSAVRP